MIKFAKDKLAELFKRHEIPESHGIGHAVIVLLHSNNALKYTTLSSDKKLNVKLASLLHDADDSKYFSHLCDTNKYINALTILNAIESEFKVTIDKDEIITMIDLVSFSKHGNNIPNYIKDDINKEYLLYPRFSDRLEAIGEIGIRRCLLYTIESNRPFYLDSTPKITSYDKVLEEATEERLQEYINKGGKSISTVDHFYDKLLHVGKFQTTNPYYIKIRDERIAPMIQFVIYYGGNGNIDPYFNNL